MNHEQRIARATRAQAAWDEFVGPVIDEIDTAYAARLREVATTELNSLKRADKLTALSVALKVTQALRSGLNEAIKDGEIAQDHKLRADRIEKMAAPQRRLLGIAPF